MEMELSDHTDWKYEVCAIKILMVVLLALKSSI